jgi:diguanylate cyclase (GGDEF)-like protein
VNDKQLETKQRVSALLLDDDLQESSILNEIKQLLDSPGQGNFCSELLKFFVHTTFDEEEAQLHWEKIFENYDYFAHTLNHNVGLRVAIFDYFVNLNRMISNPIMVEIQIFKQTEKLAMVDSLTGIFNRHYFDVSLKKEIKRALRYGKHLSLLMIDLDDFKKINDRNGHLFGDEVLKGFANILRSISREEDIPCRYGGEEFVVILPETKTDGALAYAERLRSEMRSDALLRDNRITYSGGISSFPENGEAAAELLRTADEALYEAKCSGKDRSIVNSNT